MVIPLAQGKHDGAVVPGGSSRAERGVGSRCGLKQGFHGLLKTLAMSPRRTPGHTTVDICRGPSSASYRL